MARPDLEALKPTDAKKLARSVVENGEVEFTGHARQEMKKDGLGTTDCLNLIRAGIYNTPEPHNEGWRYRIETATMAVVIAFDSEARLRVITAWRKKK